MKLKLLIFYIVIMQVGYAQLRFNPTDLKYTVIEEQENCEAIFNFTNESNFKICINNVSVSCGCISALASKYEILPGESGKIICKISKSIVVNNEKDYTIVITTDSTSSNKINLTLKVLTKEACEFYPRLLFWRKGTECEKKKLSIKLNSEEYIITDIVFPDSFIFEKSKERKFEYIVDMMRGKDATPPPTRDYELDPIKKRLQETEAKLQENKSYEATSRVNQKLDFQSLIVQFFLQRRYYHAMIANDFYRYLFAAEDGKIEGI